MIHEKRRSMFCKTLHLQSSGRVKHNETYFNLADPFRILTLKDSPGRDDTLKLSQVHRASRPVCNDSPIFCFFAKESPGWEMQAAPILSPVPTFVRQLLYTKRIYRSKEKILHDFMVWYCMPILCPFLVAVTHLAKQNLEQLASGGPSRTGSIIHPCSGTHEWRAGLLRQHFAAIQRSLHLWFKKLKDKAFHMMINDPWEEEEHVLQDFASSKQWEGET